MTDHISFMLGNINVQQKKDLHGTLEILVFVIVTDLVLVLHSTLVKLEYFSLGHPVL